ncbi:flagellar basal body P-ring formation chaperone FlgA [Quatrionicoccus australiensis]|uniref:flagellar basal body P-ring formation chaperone FlgA n=1 Tax=Quatrionicoccus australiensis TaxID=138118 RepID=UPI001CF7F92A|nr:flagellar basal body P-ring formation chaperone FlgA [Quatrionicoccus australiensis]UCV15950.1 flagellar basal body P-ring formation protein FlgA [Quatrionicoccus australiensis]
MPVRSLFFAFLLLFAGRPLLAAETDAALDTAERFVRQQTQGIPGKTTITMGKLDTVRLPPCSAYEAFSPPGTRLSGRTHVGIRCLGPNIWSALVPVQITTTGTYVTTTRPLGAGQLIQAGDLAIMTGDLSSQPTGVITDPANAIGKTLRNSLGAGQALRGDQLLAPLVIQQGQSVRVISKGNGFAVSSEGKALNNAAAGQIAQIRMNSGQTVSGVAKSDGSIEIAF